MTRRESNDDEWRLALRQRTFIALDEAERAVAAIIVPFYRANALTRLARVWLGDAARTADPGSGSGPGPADGA